MDELEEPRERRRRRCEARDAGRRWSDDRDVALAMERAQLRLSALFGELRETRDWSQERQAAAAGVHPDTVLRLEKCRSDPQLSTLVRLAAVFGLELEISLRPRR